MNKRKRSKNRNKSQDQCASDFLSSFAQKIFMQLRNAFFTILIFYHFDFFKFLKVKTNVSNKIIKIIFY